MAFFLKSNRNNGQSKNFQKNFGGFFYRKIGGKIEMITAQMLEQMKKNHEANRGTYITGGTNNVAKRPIVKQIEAGYLLGSSEDGGKDNWVWCMSTDEMVTLSTFGATIYPCESNKLVKGDFKKGKWNGWLVFETHHEAFLIWERYIEPRMLADKMAKM